MLFIRKVLFVLCCLCLSGSVLILGVLDLNRLMVVLVDVILVYEGLLGMVDVVFYGGVFLLIVIINKVNYNVQNVKVIVLGKGEKGILISYDVGLQVINIYDGIFVFGLYLDYVNKVKVDWIEEGKK